MANWSLPVLLDALHREVEDELRRARATLAHPTEKGDASEGAWLSLLSRYLPRRYEVRKAHVVDSQGAFSEQMDVVIHDRQYSPFVFTLGDSFVVPAESVYAVFEAKQEVTAEYISYAQKKAESVRRLHRTSLPVPTVDGIKPPKEHSPILAGLLALDSTWSPALGEAMRGHFLAGTGDRRLDLGCVAGSGWFYLDPATEAYTLTETARSTTCFLLELIARLQDKATVPMLDVRAYASHIPR